MRTDEEPWPDTLPAEAPVVHRDLTVTVGARQLRTLTYDHLLYWLDNLGHVRGGPFMTVSRTGDQAAFIQTYRDSDTDYLVEVYSGAGNAEYRATTVHAVSEVGQLIWDWLENDWQRIDAVEWEWRRLP